MTKTKTPPRFYMPGLNSRLSEYDSSNTRDKRDLVRRLYKAGNSLEECAKKSYGGQLPPDDHPDFDINKLPTTAHRMRQTFHAYMRKCEEWIEDLLPSATAKKKRAKPRVA